MTFAKLLATWFGLGLIPLAPGTWGSAGGLAVAWVLVEWAGLPPWALAVLAVVCTGPGIWASTQVARAARAAPGQKNDPQIIVVDEVLGQWLTLAAMSAEPTAAQWVLGFALFRLFDITKPFPVRKLEKLPEGTGIVADDLGAGVYGAMVLGAARAIGWV